ncbi:MAG: MBL fold metallo-hydrolase [Nitrososphaeria archaeon]
MPVRQTLPSGSRAEQISQDAAVILPPPPRTIAQRLIPRSNTYLLFGPEIALIDAGASLKDIDTACRVFQRRIDDLGRVILTHYHVDHNYSTGDIHKKTGAEVTIHARDREYGENLPNILKSVGLASSRKASTWYARSVERMGFKPYKANSIFRGGDRLQAGNRTLLVKHTPGHTPGHSIFLFENQSRAFTGDITFSHLGPWYGTKISDLSKTMRSIQEVIDMGLSAAFPGHGCAVPRRVSARLARFLQVIYDRNRRIMRELSRKEMTLEEISRMQIIVGGPHEVTSFWETEAVKKHLEFLRGKGMVESRTRNSQALWRLTPEGLEELKPRLR